MKNWVAWGLVMVLAVMVLGAIGRFLKPYLVARYHGKGADLHGAVLYAAPLSGSNLQGINLRYASLRWANLSHTVGGMASLRSSVTGDYYVQAADLTGADLTGANLSGAVLEWTNFQRAILRRSILCEVDMAKTHLEG